MLRVPSGAFVVRVLSALGGGALLWLSFAPRSWWFLAPFGIAALVLTVRGCRMRAGFGYGYLAGLGFFVPLLPWVGVYVGAVPWLALAAVSAVFPGVFGLVATRVWRVPGAVVWLACAWAAVEALQARVPFGGFPWGRLAFGQVEGVLLPLAGVAGAPGLSFVVALVGASLAALAVHARARERVPALLALVGVLLPVGAALALAPGVRANNDSPTTATVALVQGNVPRLGLDFNGQREAVLRNHVNETLRLAERIAAGKTPQPDLVVWPENSSDIDPLRDRDAGALISGAARAVGVPILVGAVLSREDGTGTNTMIVWDPADGAGEQSSKRVLQPFGEYLPYRDFFTKLSPYAEQAGNFVPGTGNGQVDLNGIPIAVADCWEVAFDSTVRESVQAGGRLIAVPTNNATFGRTNMTYQQLAMSQLRAVEHSRGVVVAATSGVSAVIAPDGAVEQQTEIFTPDVLTAEVPLQTTTTLATRLGSVPELVMAALAALALITGLVGRGGEHRRAGTGTTDDPETAVATKEDVRDGATAAT